MSQTMQAERAPVSSSPRFAGSKRYLTPKEAADYRGIGYSTQTIERMNGEGPAFIRWGSNVRYDVLEIDRWMAEKTVTPARVTTKRPVGRPRKGVK
jgi:hypothetical protein